MPGGDDQTDPQHLTYAFYLGATAGQARQVENPARYGILEDGETWFFANEKWAERDMYISVAAVDLAGNLSARTEPVLLRRGALGLQRLGLVVFQCARMGAASGCGARGPPMHARLAASAQCEEEDLNLHTLRYRNLNPAHLPFRHPRVSRCLLGRGCAARPRRCQECTATPSHPTP
jgi:hypothetical protein